MVKVLIFYLFVYFYKLLLLFWYSFIYLGIFFFCFLPVEFAPIKRQVQLTYLYCKVYVNFSYENQTNGFFMYTDRLFIIYFKRIIIYLNNKISFRTLKWSTLGCLNINKEKTKIYLFPSVFHVYYVIFLSLFLCFVDV